MLSGETAVGKHPVEAVRRMGSIAEATEEALYPFDRPGASPSTDDDDALARDCSHRCAGRAAKREQRPSSCSPRAAPPQRSSPTIDLALSSSPSRAEIATMRRLQLIWGVQPFLVPLATSAANLMEQAERFIVARQWASSGDNIVFVLGPKLAPGADHSIKLRRLAMTSNTNRIDISPRIISDSRGNPTVEVEVHIGGVSTIASAPAGKTKGGDEAVTVPIERAIANVRDVIAPFVREAAVDLMSHAGLIDVERRLIERAGANCQDLGANALLPVSIALWRAAAALHGQQLFQYIRAFEPELASTSRVRLFSNVLNGGYHALKKGEALGTDRFEIQELQIVPQSATTYREALAMAERVDVVFEHAAGERFRRRACRPCRRSGPDCARARRQHPGARPVDGGHQARRLRAR